MSSSPVLYADILLPLPLENTYTYRIPASLIEEATFGKRVEVQFGSKKRYAGLIIDVTTKIPDYRTKEIISVLDNEALIFPWQLSYWQWMASYYCCSPGEVMKAALPGALLLSSETVISIMPVNEDEVLQLASPLYEIIRIIQSKETITLLDLEKVSGLKILYPHIISLYKLGMIIVVEELAERYVPKRVKLIQLTENFNSDEGLHNALDIVSKNENQTNLLLSYLANAGPDKIAIEPKEILLKAGSDSSVLKSLIKKGIFKEVLKEINRMDLYKKDIPEGELHLTLHQTSAYHEILDEWKEKEVVLLHGITGSGKTIIYTKLIAEIIKKGGQVLYLVPEIGLSVQILNRLQKQFGKQITISHSRLNENERVDLWNQVKNGIPIVAGVRSSVFLPFNNLKLIIVDEEHDTSYKQQDPNPRYHARDSAIYLGKQLKANVLLGSATPSIDSSFHCENNKYGRTYLTERYLGIQLPDIIIVDKRKDKSAEGSPYSHTLIEAMKLTLIEKKQIIIFKNRRGYSPVLKCNVCQWIAECHQCDISLTYHKGRNKLICHVCGTSKPLINICPACGSPHLVLEGYGTEKIEDELNVIFPNVSIRRMDLDTTRGKHNMENLIYDFERGNIDILVGTQMVTKGLDFDNVGLVGVIYADQALHYPDFRSSERIFQTLVQVSGRAGRKNEKGKVMIQTFQPEHPVFNDVVNNDYRSFYEREIKEREVFRYPPFVRQIAITIKHKQADISREAAEILAIELRDLFGQRILGPTIPTVSRIRNQFLQVLYIKMEKDVRIINEIKSALKNFQTGIVKRKSLSTVRISIDVDPYH
ncbi:MAG TPA: primosomal protein N' [Saprospiraceae bacterium]|nr:primosomal protein N' [Saprospiraceae bacterium]